MESRCLTRSRGAGRAGKQARGTTADGRKSAQFEHTFLVTETGCEILTGRLDQPDGMVWDLATWQR